MGSSFIFKEPQCTYSEKLLRLCKKIPNGNKKFVQKKNAGIEKRLEKKNRRFKRIDSSQKAKL